MKRKRLQNQMPAQTILTPQASRREPVGHEMKISTHSNPSPTSSQYETNLDTNGVTSSLAAGNSYANDYDIPPSPCATSTTSSPVTPGSCLGADHNDVCNNIPYNAGTKYTIRYGPPDDRRSVPKVMPPPNSITPSTLFSPRKSSAWLDPQYASRLYRSTEEEENDRNDALLMPPPRLWRNNEEESNGKQSAEATSRKGHVNSQEGAQSCANFNESESVKSDAQLSGALAQTPFFTPKSKSSSISRGTSQSPHNNSANRSQSSSFDFYTPKRSPRSLVGHRISFSTPTKSAKSLSDNSTKRKNQSPRYTDRFIPSRASSNLNFSVWDNEDQRCTSNTERGNGNMPSHPTNSEEETPRQETGAQNGLSQSQQPPLLNMLLRSELLGENIDPSSNSQFVGTAQSQRHTRNPLREGGNYLRYNQSQRQGYHDGVYSDPSLDPATIVDSFSLSPVRLSSNHHLMSMPQKRKRKIAKVPFKVLDAPALADDFYLNLVDWSSLNVLAVGLGSCVYLWSACTSKVTKLCDLSGNQDADRAGSSENAVTSVSWTQRGTHLAVGVNNGEVQLWDTVKCEKLRTMGGHSARIGALSWSGPTLASGSRDRLIYLRDMRVQQPFTARLASHKQEVCGLKWSFDEPACLASGGNDNKLLVWDIKNHRQPIHRFAEHTAAVKAIAWSPHQHGLLASGGGTADRCIRFWNALSGSKLSAIDTGSQVCNLAWSQNCNEIVSTHGYSLNQIALWKYPTMQKVATLTGHTYRVLYLAMSPDGSTIVTGAGDETLRFWQVFPGPRSNDKNGKNGLLFPSSPISVLR